MQWNVTSAEGNSLFIDLCHVSKHDNGENLNTLICGKEDDMDCTKELLHNGLEEAIHKAEEILKKAKDYAQESMKDFATDNHTCLGGLIGVYYNLFTSLGVKSRQELEKVCERNFRHLEIQESWHELEAVEREWNRFLDESELTAGGNKIIVVSFGGIEGARQWLEVTQCHYELLLDPDRKLYHALGLGRSMSKVWKTDTLNYYAEQKASGRALPKPVEDDPLQMGGDFVIDPTGHMVYIHCSKDPTDRPSVEHLIYLTKDHAATGPEIK